MPKKRKKKSPKGAAPPLGRLGAERWIAVRQKSGAGPIDPEARKRTRTQQEREAIEREAGPGDVPVA
jgi:hypothetical protein